MPISYRHDLSAFDFDTIQAWLSTTYWSPGISRERVVKGFNASTLCIAAFDGARQIGVGRCISDTTRFGYIADVFVSDTHRGQGIARSMVRQMMEHPNLKDVSTWYLLTRDAQEVYKGLGFEVFPRPDNFMIYKKTVPTP